MPYGKRWYNWSCKLLAHCQQDVCMMPNNFTAVGLKRQHLKMTTIMRCLHTVCMLTAHCTYFAWEIVGCLVLSTQMDGFQTYVKLGGHLQYLLHYKSGVVEVLLFPGRIMEDIGKFNSNFIHKVIKMYKYKKYPT